MTEVQIKEHQRKSKNGKSVTVKGYTRRVGRKGVHSPKKDKSTAAGSGEEFQAKKASAAKEKPKYTGPQMTEEEIRKWDAAARAATMSRYQSSKKPKSKASSKSSSHSATVKDPLSEKGSMQIFNRIEDKVARFVEKYSNKKYKRMVK